jgi:hypothetical protein
MIKRMSLYCDNLLNRDKYLSSLNSRILYFKELEGEPTNRVIDEHVASEINGNIFVPEIDASDFNVEFLKKAVRESGCLIVRNYFCATDVETMKSFVDHSFAVNGNPDGLINKYLSRQIDLEPVLEKTREVIKKKRATNPTYTNKAKSGARLTKAMGNSQSFLTAQTPILAEKLLNLFERKQLKSLLGDYFGNEPCVSVYKWVLRKSEPPATPLDFHQDGAFMGEEISSLNCWIPLSDCGTGFDVHGLDIVPVRLLKSFQKGSGGMAWTISTDAVVEEYTRNAIVTPTFRKGDLFFFDHLLVHRSQSLPECSQRRYAIETWFFDSVNFPKNQIPIRW